MLIGEYMDGGFADRDPLQTRFPPSIAQGEKIVCFGQFTRQWLGAIGNGSYGSIVAGGTGAFGAALLVGSAIGNARARNHAAANAQITWRQYDSGNIYFSDHGFYLETTQALLPFAFGSLAECDMVTPGMVQIGCELTTGGYHRFRLQSHYAELVMLSWAIMRHPSHPYLASYSTGERRRSAQLRGSAAATRTSAATEAGYSHQAHRLESKQRWEGRGLLRPP